LLRRSGALLEEQKDEWPVGRRYFSTESMSKRYEPSQEAGAGSARLAEGLVFSTEPRDRIYATSRDATWLQPLRVVVKAPWRGRWPVGKVVIAPAYCQHLTNSQTRSGG
jgi:hypothetical protein